jgi:hypothetical protein
MCCSVVVISNGYLMQFIIECCAFAASEIDSEMLLCKQMINFHFTYNISILGTIYKLKLINCHIQVKITIKGQDQGKVRLLSVISCEAEFRIRRSIRTAANRKCSYLIT